MCMHIWWRDGFLLSLAFIIATFYREAVHSYIHFIHGGLLFIAAMHSASGGNVFARQCLLKVRFLTKRLKLFEYLSRIIFFHQAEKDPCYDNQRLGCCNY